MRVTDKDMVEGNKIRSDEAEKQTKYINHRPPDVLDTGTTVSFPGDAQ